MEVEGLTPGPAVRGEIILVEGLMEVEVGIELTAVERGGITWPDCNRRGGYL